MYLIIILSLLAVGLSLMGFYVYVGIVLVVIAILLPIVNHIIDYVMDKKGL